MVALIIATYCQLAFYSNCEQEIHSCVEKINQIKYMDSMWLDIPDEKMSLESFYECTQIIENKTR